MTGFARPPDVLCVCSRASIKPRSPDLVLKETVGRDSGAGKASFKKIIIQMGNLTDLTLK